MLIFRNIKGRNVPLITRNQRVYNHQISFWDKLKGLFGLGIFRISHLMGTNHNGYFLYTKFNASRKLHIEQAAQKDAYRNIPNYNHGAINLTTKENQILEKVETIKNQNTKYRNNYIRTSKKIVNEQLEKFDNNYNNSNDNSYLKQIKNLDINDLRSAIDDVNTSYGELCKFRNDHEIIKEKNYTSLGNRIFFISLFIILFVIEFGISNRNAGQYIIGGLATLTANLVFVSLILPLLSFSATKYFIYWLNSDINNEGRRGRFLFIGCACLALLIILTVFGVSFIFNSTDLENPNEIFIKFRPTFIIWLIGIIIMFIKALHGYSVYGHFGAHISFYPGSLLSVNAAQKGKNNSGQKTSTKTSYNGLVKLLKTKLDEINDINKKFIVTNHNKLKELKEIGEDMRTNMNNIVAVQANFYKSLIGLEKSQLEFLKTYAMSNQQHNQNKNILKRLPLLLKKSDCFNLEYFKRKDDSQEYKDYEKYQLALRKNKWATKDPIYRAFEQKLLQEQKNYNKHVSEKLLSIKKMLQDGIVVPSFGKQKHDFKSPLNDKREFAPLIKSLEIARHEFTN